MSNVYNILKKEIGYIISTNQYIELVSRIYTRDYNIKEIQNHSKSVGLNVSVPSDNHVLVVAHYYILGIHSSIERFCLDYKNLPGSPTYNKGYSAEKDGSRLSWTVKMCYISGCKDEISALLEICEYYRFVRNCILHNNIGDDSAELRKVQKAFAKLKVDSTYSKLSAPNSIEHITFDDQVLFSRAAQELCRNIFFESTYNSEAIYENFIEEIEKCIGIVKDCQGKKEAKIKNFLSQHYPVNKIENLNAFINRF